MPVAAARTGMVFRRVRIGVSVTFSPVKLTVYTCYTHGVTEQGGRGGREQGESRGVRLSFQTNEQTCSAVQKGIVCRVPCGRPWQALAEVGAKIAGMSSSSCVFVSAVAPHAAAAICSKEGEAR